MKKNWKLLMLGVTAMFLLQSCVTVHKARHPHHHHHRHGTVINQPTIDVILYNMPATYMAMNPATVYEHKG